MYARIRHGLLCIAALLLLVSNGTMAQITGSLEGTVRYHNGAPHTNAIVRILKSSRGAVSKGDGTYTVAALRPGEYTVQIDAYGCDRQRHQIRIEDNKTTKLDVILRTIVDEEYKVFTPAGIFTGAGKTPTISYQGIPKEKKLKVTAFRATHPLDALLNAYPGYFPVAAKDNPISPENLRAVEAAVEREEVESWTHDLPAGYDGSIATVPLQISDPGVYYIEVQGEVVERRYMVVISELALVMKSKHDKVLAYIANARTGRRVPHTELTCLINGDQIGAAATNADGVAEIPLPLSVKNYPNQPMMLFGEKDGNVIIATWSNHWVAPSATPKIFLHTDKPVYRPEQPVQFRGIVRGMDANGEYVTMTNQPAVVEIRDSRNSLVNKQTIMLSDLGTFDGRYLLGAEPALGSYTVVISSAGTTQSSSFTVAEYKKPEFSVDVKIPRERYKIGETIEANVKAHYFFGSDVANGDVEYAVYRTPIAGHGAKSQWGPSPPPAATEMVHNGRGRLRSDGTYVISYETEATEKKRKGEEKEKEKWGEYIYSVRVNVTDNSRRAVDGAATTRVTRGDLGISVSTAKNFYAAPEILKVDVRIVGFGKTNAGNIPFTLTARRIGWERNSDGTLKESSSDIWTKNGVTDAEGRATISSPVTYGGYIELRAEAQDPSRALVSGSANVYTHDSSFDEWTTPDQNMHIITEKASYNHGDTLRALIVAPFDAVDALITAEGEMLHGYHVRELGGRAAMVAFPLNGERMSGITLDVQAFKQGGALTATKNVAVRPLNRMIDLSVTADKRAYSPGAKGKLAIRARDYRGRPVRNADVALAMVDASIYSISPDITPEMLPHFYSPRPNLVTTQHQIGPDPNIVQWQQSRSRRFMGNTMAMAMNDLNATRSYDRVTRQRTVTSDDIVVTSARTNIQSAVALSAGVMEEGERGDYDAAPLDNALAPETRDVVAHADTGFAMKKAAYFEPVMVAPVLRSEFRDVMLWVPSVRTDSNGLATVDLEFPDNLTEWRVTGRAVDEATAVGEASDEVLTRRNLLVRMETPRFLVKGDELLIATTVHNYLPTDKVVEVQIAGKNVEIGAQSRKITIPAYGEQRIDWPVTASTLDTARLIVRALTDEESDAMELAVPVIPGGMKRVITASARLRRTDSEQRMELFLPKNTHVEGRSLSLALSPSVNSSLMGALDDLVAYPYGCVEQTMSRFLPLIVVANAVQKTGVPFDEKKRQELPKMVASGVNRLFELQNPKGGWGWWQNDRANPQLTAYVMYGLTIARQAGYEVNAEHYARGFNALHEHFTRGSELDATTLAYMLYVASAIRNGASDKVLETSLAKLSSRSDLSPYAISLLALAARHQNNPKTLSELAARLASSVTDSGENVSWGAMNGDYRWQGDNVETSAFAVKALIAAGGYDALVQRGVEWLLLQKRGNSWHNTRQTSTVIFALTDYMHEMGVTSEGYRVVVKLNGNPVFDTRISGAQLIGSEQRLTLHGAMLRDGNNVVTIEKIGDGGLRASAILSYYEDISTIQAENAGFEVSQEYFVLNREKRGERNIYTKGAFSGSIASGDEILVKVKVRSPKAHEFFMLESHLPAGCELVEDVGGFIIEGEKDYSGTPAGEEGKWKWWYADREVRDEKIAFFATELQKGEHEFSYILRAQIPGSYRVLPAVGMLAYYPEVNGNSNPMSLVITPGQGSMKRPESPSLR